MNYKELIYNKEQKSFLFKFDTFAIYKTLNNKRFFLFQLKNCRLHFYKNIVREYRCFYYSYFSNNSIKNKILIFFNFIIFVGSSNFHIYK